MTLQIKASTIWTELQSELKPGAKFHTWSVTGRARAIPFAFESIDSKEIVIRRLNDSKTYTIFKSSAEAIAEVWDEYLKGRYARQDIRSGTFSSSYVLGIFAKLSGKYA